MRAFTLSARYRLEEPVTDFAFAIGRPPLGHADIVSIRHRMPPWQSFAQLDSEWRALQDLWRHERLACGCGPCLEELEADREVSA